MLAMKFDQIDGLRFFAVFAVLCVHWHWYGSYLCDLTTLGSRGVDLFFAISGFLITLGLIRSKESGKNTGDNLYKFYIRRFLRIFPVYYLTVFILFIVWHDRMASTIWWYVLYLANFFSIKTQDWGVAGHFWSLSVEEQFYFVWPFIILFIPNKRLPIIIISSILLSLSVKSYWVFNSFPFWYIYMHPLAALDILALGGLLAYLYHFHPNNLKKLIYQPIVAIIIIFQVALVIYIRKVSALSFIHDICIRTSFGIFSIWLIGRAVFGFSGAIGYILENSVLRYIGKISYAIYLFHPFVPKLLYWVSLPANENIRFAIYFIITVTLASLSWYLFERPILQFKERFE